MECSTCGPRKLNCMTPFDGCGELAEFPKFGSVQLLGPYVNSRWSCWIYVERKQAGILGQVKFPARVEMFIKYRFSTSNLIPVHKESFLLLLFSHQQHTPSHTHNRFFITYKPQTANRKPQTQCLNPEQLRTIRFKIRPRLQTPLDTTCVPETANPDNFTLAFVSNSTTKSPSF
jgi:hypothetical protein